MWCFSNYLNIFKSPIGRVFPYRSHRRHRSNIDESCLIPEGLIITVVLKLRSVNFHFRNCLGHCLLFLFAKMAILQTPVSLFSQRKSLEKSTLIPLEMRISKFIFTFLWLACKDLASALYRNVCSSAWISPHSLCKTGEASSLFLAEKQCFHLCKFSSTFPPAS